MASEGQKWVTSASDDDEGLKALMLGRSLRRSITTRELLVIISFDVSDEIWDSLQDVFDNCIRISKRQRELHSDKSFNYVAKLQCLKLMRLKKFVFLDCNCLVLKHSDELFKKNGFGYVKQSNGEMSVVVTANIADLDDTEVEESFEMIENFKKLDSLKMGKELIKTEEKYNLEKKYCTEMDFLNVFPITGTEIKIVYFVNTHPLDLLVSGEENLFSDIEKFKQEILKVSLDLILKEEISYHIKRRRNDKVKNDVSIRVVREGSTPNFKMIEKLKSSIAIVGMSFKFPGANTIDEFWNLLITGQDAITKVPVERWNKDQCFVTGDHSKDIKAGFIRGPIDQIDGKFFGMSSAELEYMDPQQRLTLQVVWEGLENAGINPLSLKNTNTGVFGGCWRLDYKEMFSKEGANENGFLRVYMGNTFGTLTGRISHFFELTGPSISTESGCSTSIVGADMACNSLRNETCDIGIAFGVNLLIYPFRMDTMNGVLAMDGHCKTFDTKADGFGRAEGCAVLVLKRFGDAISNGDRIWGLIRGSAVVQEGPSKSMGTPTVQCEALAMSLALEKAGVQPKDVSFVETHGTGTPIGDPVEIAAVASVYSKNRQEILTIGSVKTNIGHTESVSGLAGIVKTILSLQNEMIPPHLHLETLNPLINLDIIPAQIPMTPLRWKKNSDGRPRIAGVSSFGITGTDAHFIIQETPDTLFNTLETFESRPLHIVTISAKSPEGLDEYLELYQKYLLTTNHTLKDIELTTQVARGHFPHRVCIVGNTKDEIKNKIQNKSFEVQKSLAEAPKLCFLFTGQGSHYRGMAEDLYKHSLVFKSHFDICENLLAKNHGVSIKKGIWVETGVELSSIVYGQGITFCTEYCLLKLWESWGVKPNCVLGHSLGEFVAAVAAGILDFEDALMLMAVRAPLIAKLRPGKMLVVKEGLSNVENLMNKAFEGSDNWLDVAAINTQEQTVLAGEETSILKFKEFCKNKEIKSLIFEADHAFHSRHMDILLDEYREACLGVTFHPSTCKYISGIEARLMGKEEVDAEYWVRLTRNTVNFLGASKSAFENNCTQFLEIGPQPVLCSMILSNSDNANLTTPLVCLPSLRRKENEWNTMLNSLAKLYVNGVEINWDGYHRYSNANKVDSPSHPFQPKSYWMDMDTENRSISVSSIHPLVGSQVLNPMPFKLFNNNMNISNLLYLKDHVVGNKIIFPGAAFLEMCLVSGHSAVQCTDGSYSPPTAAISIENFRIEAPLCLNEKISTQLQIVVSTEDSGETLATIHSKLSFDKETHKWIKHASGSFLPFASKWEWKDEFQTDSLENIKARCTESISSETFYKESTVSFGSTFQTIKAVFKGDDEVYFKISVTPDSKRYICHPVMIDAMFQTIVCCMNPDKTKLHVPISIKKFILFAKLNTETCYIYIKTPNTNLDSEYTAVLMDENGELVAVMVGAEFMETTVGNIIAVLEAQRMPYPSMYEDVWREHLGPFERRIEKLELKSITKNQGNLIREAEADGNSNRFDSAQNQYLFEQTHHLNALYMIKALQDLGIDAKIGEVFRVEELVKTFNIQKHHFNRLLRYMLIELAEEGYFKVLDGLNGNTDFKLIKLFPEKIAILTEIEMISEKLKMINEDEINCVAYTGKCLADILTGRQSALSILFPDDSSKEGPAALYYRKSLIFGCFVGLSNCIFSKFINFIKENRTSPKAIVRILEIGAGTGSFTETVLPHFLADGGSFYEYTYTDISPAFASSGEKIFENSKMRVNYKVLNIEEDPMSQGFFPHHYDLIYASYVIHATKDIERSLANVRSLLKEGGSVMLTELIKPHRSINLLFGVLEGFWKFTDVKLRPYNCEMDVDKWKMVLQKLKFDDIASVKISNSHCAIISAVYPQIVHSGCISKTLRLTVERKKWIIFSEGGAISEFMTQKLLELKKEVILVKSIGQKNFKNVHKIELVEVRHDNSSDVETLLEDRENKIEGILYLWAFNYMKPNYEEVCQPFLYLCKTLVNKATNIKLFVFTQGSVSVEDQEVQLPTATPILGMAKTLQNENQILTVKCIDLDQSSVDSIFEEGFTELFTTDGEMNVAYRRHRRMVPRIIPLKIHNTDLKFTKSGYFRLVLPQTRAISDLRFGPMEKVVLKENYIEVRVKAYGLNFRDVFAVMKPDVIFENLHTVGIDYSGVVTATGSGTSKFKIGDAVWGINLTGDAMPSHIHVDECMVIGISNEMTFCEAATLPAVVLTAYVCLIEVANLKKEDTILIHTASGGVGLLAVQIAQSKGCTIIATAGSKRKQTFLRNLGIKHVFYSRNTDYEKDIRDALRGRGVDVVLNSLTSEGFKEASLASCNQNARFVEMSKLNVWTKEEVNALRPDVQYDIVDLSATKEANMKKLMEKIAVFTQTCVKPIPYVRFDAGEIREALNYLQKAKHIGKIICVMPEVKSVDSSNLQTPVFNDRSTYMITGGLGGIGWEVAKWMISSGAKHIVLVGRNPAKEKTAEEIKTLISQGINVVVMQCDIGNLDQCRQLLGDIKSEDSGLPSLRGIMHAAGVLSDGFYYLQTWDKYETVFNPKIRGGWNLHELTLTYNLEHFVMFSSAAANIGSIAQSNHCAANYFLDCLASYRNSIGLPGITINWGQWGQVGVAADMEMVGIRPFTVLQGISALEKAMKCQRTQTTVLEADFDILRKNLFSVKKYSEELKISQGVNQLLAIGMDSDKFWKDYDSSKTRENKFNVTRKYISNLIRMTLKMDNEEVIPDDASFQEMGMDSLMMIELKNSLQTAIGNRITITINSTRDCKTVTQLCNKIIELASGAEEIPIPSTEELIELIKEDSKLPDEIKPENEFLVKPSEIKTVLITGVTGNFGPYVLREICKRPEVLKIYCLMRDIRSLSPKERMKEMLQEKNLLAEIDMEKIECIAGDVAKPKMGLTSELYNDLSENVDGIFHLSVKADIAEYYCKSESLSHIRSVNVLGTKNILKFACDKKTKQVFHASTALACYKVDANCRFSESWPQEGDFDDQFNSAYTISKFICDRLMAEAVERGIPCKVFRLPLMGGDSKLGGNVSIFDNHLMIKMMSYLYMGMMPARSFPLIIIPVDICADLSLQIFFNNETGYEMYNVTNPFVENELLLEKIAPEFGYTVKPVEPVELFEKVRELNQGTKIPVLDFFNRMVDREKEMKTTEENPPEVYVAWAVGNKNVYLSEKLVKWIPEYPACLKPSWEYLKNDLQFAKDSGIFAKVGLN